MVFNELSRIEHTQTKSSWLGPSEHGDPPRIIRDSRSARLLAGTIFETGFSFDGFTLPWGIIAARIIFCQDDNAALFCYRDPGVSKTFAR